MNKTDFVQNITIRLAHQPGKVAEAIELAEALWGVLQAKGYGETTPSPDAAAPAAQSGNADPSGWESLTAHKPKQDGWHPAYAPAYPPTKPKPPKTREEWQADLRHWQRLLALNPGNTSFQAIIDSIQKRLGEM